MDPTLTRSPTAIGARSFERRRRGCVCAVSTGQRESRTNVPFALPRSSIESGGPMWTAAWRRETDGLSMGTSQSAERPSTTEPASGSRTTVIASPITMASSNRGGVR